jgi:hypothetical protein
VTAGQLTLTREEAWQVHAVLAVVEDWLLGSADWVLDDLTAFLRPAGQALQVIGQLGDAGCILGQLLRLEEQ